MARIVDPRGREVRALNTLASNLDTRLVSPDTLYVDLISGGGEDPAVEELNDELVRLQLERERMLFLQKASSPDIAVANR